MKQMRFQRNTLKQQTISPQKQPQFAYNSFIYFSLAKFILQICLYRPQKWNIIIISMSTKKRINAEKDVIEHHILKQTIHKWFTGHREDISDDLVVSVRRMKELQTQFQQKCLQYTVMRMMPWIVCQFEQEKLLSLNTELKINYQKLIINAFFNTDNAFELFVFYLVKLTTLFFKDCFSNLLIEATLESEICIVLYYTFLGVEISQKTYEVIKKKYQNSTSKIVKSHIDDRSLKTSKNSTHQSNFKQSIKYTSKNKPPKKRNSIYSRQSICKPIKQSFYKDSVYDISEALQQNLHVSPLPPLKERRVKIRQIERMKTQPISQQPYYCTLQSKDGGISKEPKAKRNYFLSNQLSNSLKTLHPQQLLFELTSKQIKINQSFHDFKISVTQDPLCQLKKRKVQLKQNAYKKQSDPKNELKSSNDWITIVDDLKKKVFELRYKSGSDQNKRQRQNQEARQQLETMSFTTNCLETSPSLNKPFSTKQPSTSPQGKRQQIFFSKVPVQQTNNNSHFDCQNNESIVQYPKRQAPPKKKTRNSLRYDQVSFENSCKARLSSFLCTDQEKENLNKEWKTPFGKQ